MISQVLEFIRAFDRWLLLTVNGCHNPLLDFFFELITGKLVWLPFYLLLAFHLYKRFTAGFFWLVLFALLAVVISDQVASSVCKPFFHRLRPCHVDELSVRLHLLDGHCGGAYGFVSSHAANTFALAVFVYILIGKRISRLTIVLFSWAGLVSISRVYLGVHYPLDILGGGLVGSAAGIFGAYLYQRVMGRRLSST
jgi:undecaprenyl-diphosphatase